MSDEKDKLNDGEEETPRSPRQSSPPEKFDGDLNFATDSSLGPGNDPRLEKDDKPADPPQDTTEKTWVMFDGPGSGADEEFAEGARDAAEPSSDVDDESTDATSDTWVPGPDDESDHDASKTVVMPSRMDDAIDFPAVDETGDTWVPLADSAASTTEASSSEESTSEQATHHDFSFEAASNKAADDAGEDVAAEDDPNKKTWNRDIQEL